MSAADRARSVEPPIIDSKWLEDRRFHARPSGSACGCCGRRQAAYRVHFALGESLAACLICAAGSLDLDPAVHAIAARRATAAA